MIARGSAKLIAVGSAIVIASGSAKVIACRDAFGEPKAYLRLAVQAALRGERAPLPHELATAA